MTDSDVQLGLMWQHISAVSALLAGEVTSCQFAALYSESSPSSCPVGIKNAQPPLCSAKEAAPCAWQLWGTFTHILWVSYWLLEVKEELLTQE